MLEVGFFILGYYESRGGFREEVVISGMSGEFFDKYDYIFSTRKEYLGIETFFFRRIGKGEFIVSDCVIFCDFEICFRLS